MYKNIRIFILSFLILGTFGVSGTALALPDFNSAVSTELGRSADMDTLYQRTDQIYDVMEHDDSHIIWKFTGTTGDYAFVFADGRLAVGSMANFNLQSKDTLEKELNDLIDLIDTVAGITQDEREYAVDHSTYYASEAGVYQRIKYKSQSFNLKLSVPDCTIYAARLTAEFLSHNRHNFEYYIDNELVANYIPKGGRPMSLDMTSIIPSGVHDISLNTNYGGSSTIYIEAYTTPATKKMVLYSDDYKTWIEDTTQTVTLDQLPGFIGSVAPPDTNAELPTTPTEPETSAEISTACVHLYGEKTDVMLGEDIRLKLSAVNKITNPTMTLQVILIPPSGMSVTSADFVESGAGLYTSTYVIEPGKGRNIEVGIRSNQVGDFVVNGEVIYYFGVDKETAEEHTLSLPIKVTEGSNPIPILTPTDTSESGKGTPGFEAVFAVAGLLLVTVLIKRGG